MLGVDIAIVDKRRISAEQVEMNAIIGDVKGKDVLLLDDMCSTGGTLKAASLACKRAGARRICAAVTHGLMVGNELENSAIEKMWMCNTVPMSYALSSPKIEVVSVANLFAKAIDSIVGAKSISSLYDRPN